MFPTLQNKIKACQGCEDIFKCLLALSCPVINCNATRALLKDSGCDLTGCYLFCTDYMLGKNIVGHHISYVVSLAVRVKPLER